MYEEDAIKDLEQKKKALGSRLKELRQNMDKTAKKESERKYTQEQMAQALGVSRPVYISYETGRIMPKYDFLVRV